MENRGKNSLHMVETNWDEIEEKIRKHRLKRLKRLAVIVGICLAAVIAYYVFMQHKSYTDYTVREEISRTDTPATHYVAYGEGFLKYSNDGVSYENVNSDVIWNQSYEMENPMVSVCESYVAVADRQGDKIFVLNEDGLQGEITVSMPIARIDVAAQGTVAVLMEESGTGYLSLYNRGGELLAEGAIHVENGGTPMDIALSDNGALLGVSILEITDGTAGTTINFYNFSAVGQNQIDNLVSSYTYSDTIIPELVYTSSGTMLAFADNGVYTFTGNDTPKEGNQLTVDQEIQSVFFDDSYFGLVFTDSSADTGRVIRIYDLRCSEQTTIQTEFSYDSIGFLDNHEICMFTANQCRIYTLGGLEKFAYEFEDEEIRGIFHDSGYRNYIILKEGVTERARLKLFGKVTEDKG